MKTKYLVVSIPVPFNTPEIKVILDSELYNYSNAKTIYSTDTYTDACNYLYLINERSH